MFKIMGIDEAGRGPVVGSLFIGFAFIVLQKKEDFENFENYLRTKGVKDSKKLTPKKRNEIYQILKSEIDFKYVQLTPKIIDDNFFSGDNLNNLQLNSLIHIIQDEKPDMIIIDALTSNPESYKQKIQNKLNYNPLIISINKADDKYAIVGAASIMAKELREQEIHEIKTNLNLETGSGYPADPKTKKFLKENYNNEKTNFVFRKSWTSYTNCLNKNELKEFENKHKQNKLKPQNSNKTKNLNDFF